MTHGSLFSGIGGFDLASEWMGWENKFHCEWNEFGQKVLKHYWPKSESYGDITKTDFTIWNGRIDILTGGFPCQPYSQAGKRLGKEDERHLWPEMLRAIREIQPRWVVGENVFGLVNWNDGMVFDEVQADLEAEGYEVQPYVLPAVAVNAPHRRDRIWFVAHRDGSPKRTPRTGGRFEGDGCKDNDEQKSRGTSGQLGIGCGKVLQPTSNPDRNGIDQRHGEHEVKPSEGGVNALCEIGSGDSDGITSHARGLRCGGCAQATRSVEPIGGRELVSDIGHNWNEVRCEVAGCGADVTDTNGIRLQGGLRQDGGKQEIPRQYASTLYTRTGKCDWQNFPTQPPVCGGDDGLPTQLDGITFSKWRNESIKAYGNAIVPQVAHQIFKAIEAYEKIISDNA